MNKKIGLWVLIIGIAVGGFAGYSWYQNKDSAQELQKLQMEGAGGEWNGYAEKGRHMHTMKDLLISAGKGEYVVKMTVTLDFKDEESYMKFNGYSSLAEGKKASEEESHGGGEEHATPMETASGDAITSLMLAAEEEQIVDHKALKTYLFDNLYKELGLKENHLHALYIENYVVQ